MNINVLIWSVMVLTTLVFLISIILLIYYSVKAKGLIEPSLINENKTIFDIALSEKADFTKYPEGQAILEVIKNFK